MTVQLNPCFTFPLSEFPIVENAVEKTVALAQKMSDPIHSLRVKFSLDGDDDDIRDSGYKFDIIVLNDRSFHLCIHELCMSEICVHDLTDDPGDEIMFCEIDLDNKTLIVQGHGIELDHPLVRAIQSKCEQSLEEFMND